MTDFDPTSFDPATVPVQPAATVMIVEDRPVEGSGNSASGRSDSGELDLHVLMLKRTSRVVFASGAWVFPGGRVDPEDHLGDFDRICNGLTDAEASRILDVDHGGLAWWIAACRETLEEAGLLLAANEHDADVVALRDRVREEESVFVDLLLEHDIRIDTTRIEEVARFITPMGSPRRFDARFFVAVPEVGQEPHHDDGEIVAWEWVRPADALRRFRAGEFEMISPTVRMVQCLMRYDDAESVLAAAKQRRPYQRVRVLDPEGAYHVVLPGEPGYEEAELEVESGWVRF